LKFFEKIKLLKKLFHPRFESKKMKKLGGQPPKKKTKFQSTIQSVSTKCSLNFSSPKNLLTSLIVNSCLSLEQFFENYWEKEHLVMKSSTKKDGDFKQYFSSLFNVEILKEIASKHLLEKDIDACACKISKDKKVNKTNLKLSAKGVQQALNENFTIQLHQPQRFCNELWKIQHHLECFFASLVGSNVYITPQNSQGLAPHHDDVEVFVLQLQGSKVWRLYKPIEVLPSDCSGDLDRKNLDLIKEVTLEQGDILYMPRGLVHEARVLPGAGTSVHVTISTFQHNTCGSCLQDIVTDLLQNVTDEMRNGLPIQRFCGPSHEAVFRNEIVKSYDRAMDLVRKKISHEELPFDDIAIDFFSNRLPPWYDESSENKIDLELNEMSEVRFRYPNHILVMKFDEAADSECDSDEESEDEEEKSVVYYSSSNDRSTHLIKTKRLEHLPRITFPIEALQFLKKVHDNREVFTKVESKKFVPVLKELSAKRLIQIKKD